MLSAKSTLIAGAIFGFFSVALGAFGAHALKDYLLETNRLDTYEKAVQYQMYHALALLFVGILGLQFPELKLDWVGLFFVLGILIFSGSLYVLCGTGIRWMGAITPLGGICFLVGWGMLAWKVTNISVYPK